MTEARLLMFRRRPVPLPWAGIIDFSLSSGTLGPLGGGLPWRLLPTV